MILNEEYVGRILRVLKDALRPYVEGVYEARYGPEWLTKADQVLRTSWPSRPYDAQALLKLMYFQWRELFAGPTVHRAMRSWVAELIESRNVWAHDDPITAEEAYRVADTVQRLLVALGAHDQASDVDRQRKEILKRISSEGSESEDIDTVTKKFVNEPDNSEKGGATVESEPPPVEVNPSRGRARGRYAPLGQHLQSVPRSTAWVQLTFGQIRDLIGAELPPSASKYQAWWANSGGSHVHAIQWLTAGWRVDSVDFGRKSVVFVRA